MGNARPAKSDSAKADVILANFGPGAYDAATVNAAGTSEPAADASTPTTSTISAPTTIFTCAIGI